MHGPSPWRRANVSSPRMWRTRADPFDEDWPVIELMLRDAPAMDVKTAFDDLVARRPGVWPGARVGDVVRVATIGDWLDYPAVAPRRSIVGRP